MKQYTIIGLVSTIAIIALLSGSVFSQKADTKVESFHTSLKYETAGNYTKAIQSLLPVVKEHEDDYLLNLRLGWLYYLDGKNKESKQYYSSAVGLNGKSVEALLGRTLPLASLNEWDAVEADYRAILKMDPMQYTANLRLGQILLSRGSYLDAKAYLEKAHGQFPGSYEPNLSLGWTCYYLGDKKNAGILLTTALMLSPGDTLAAKGLGLLR
jgi:tetratricopeptide (TPR) repeat protein